MKHSFLILFCLFVLNSGVKAGNYKMIAFEQLPETSRKFIKDHFSDLKISYTAKEVDFLELSYKVIFADGNKLEFSRSGQWKEIDFKFSAIPPSAVPQAILDFVTQNHAQQNVLEIDRERWKTEVKLSNEMELNFDNDYNFIGLDD